LKISFLLLKKKKPVQLTQAVDDVQDEQFVIVAEQL